MGSNSSPIPKTSRDQVLELALPQDIYTGVSSSKILVVGAGGIGCELLKNLVLSGFRHIELVDLDTIDISNLNRQFLFQKQHVSQSKALVAAKAAEKFNPGVKIVPYHANIKDKKFDLSWFQSFNLVMNALDNLDARRYVNRMCLDAKVPLIESGTAGYVGQATVISRKLTECFECNPKETPKTYPVCTIRSTPSQPIHCIVWAKSYLFNQLFGEDDDQFDSSQDENRTEIEELKKEAEALKAIKESMKTAGFCQNVFEKVFNRDVSRLANCEGMWKDRQPPHPLSYTSFDLPQLESQALDREVADTAIPTLEESFFQFTKSTAILARRLLEARSHNPTATLAFDKDDHDTLEFVVAASNLRAHIFGIAEKSLFDIKAMAGNIIPAIATTNAIIAGAVVMQAFKILQGKIESCYTSFLVSGSGRSRLLCSEALAKPNPECYVCSQETLVASISDLHNTSIGSLIEALLPLVCSFYNEANALTGSEIDLSDLEADLSVAEGQRILHDPDVDNSEASLLSLGIVYGSKLTIDFDCEDLNPLNFIVQPGKDTIFPSLTARHVLSDSPKALVRSASPNQEDTKKIRMDISDDDDLVMVE
ncbi:E1 ubiquitin-activating protein uba2, variant 3 [Entomophthora muscae]|uniref:E1 ubiquitin-activating protein uba2, variant 3 n=2 Tax=Entomophthora muscae TaxID=34485 RepID=A0ACC2SAL8_9FUNG|nr:E1 ubiquitin-activating protein uba2, variant 3 [Entomophthora muscae]